MNAVSVLQFYRSFGFVPTRGGGVMVRVVASFVVAVDDWTWVHCVYRVGGDG
jgi:hypothetical protein